MAYNLGNEELDARLRSLVADSSDNDTGNQDLIEELIVTAIKLHRDGASRAEAHQHRGERGTPTLSSAAIRSRR